jgi:DNA repair exonuclease SbcCD ATPase subunit
VTGKLALDRGLVQPLRMHETQLDRIEGRLKRIEQQIQNLSALTRATLSEVLNMAINFDTLTAKVSELETVNQSAIELLGQLATIIRSTQPTQEAINALADRLDADKQELASAVTANTPTQ